MCKPQTTPPASPLLSFFKNARAHTPRPLLCMMNSKVLILGPDMLNFGDLQRMESSSPHSAALDASSNVIGFFRQPLGVSSHGARAQRIVGLENKERTPALSLRSSVVASALTTCNTALAARCSTEQQTIQNPVSTKSPVQARQKENLPKLDDGGPGGGPGRGDGGGGGGGGGGGWAGGFFLWGFLLLLSFIREKEKDKPYRQGTLTKSKLRKMREAQLQ